MSTEREQPVSLYVMSLALYFSLLILGAMNIGSFGSLLRYIGFIPAFFGIIRIIRTKQLLVTDLTKFVLLFAIWAAISTVWSLDSSSSISTSISYITFFLLVLSAIGQTYNEKEIYVLKNSLIWASRISMLASLLFGSYTNGRLVFSGVIDEDPNYLCGYYFFSLANAIVVLCSEESLKKKIVAAVELFLIAYLIIATGSRGGAFGAIACALIVLIMLQIRDRGSLKVIFRPIIIILAISIASGFLVSISSSDMLTRFSAETIAESNGTNRYDIWRGTINAFIQSNIIRELVGYGAGTAKAVGRLFGFTTNVTHNAFLQVLIELGLVGFFFYIIYIFRLAFFSIRSKEIFSSGVVVGMIVLSLSTSILTFKPYWNILIFIVCLSCREEEMYVEKEN